MKLLGKSVRILTKDDYYGLNGIVVNYKNDDLFRIRFIRVPRKEMTKSLWLTRDLFEVRKENDYLC